MELSSCTMYIKLTTAKTHNDRYTVAVASSPSRSDHIVRGGWNTKALLDLYAEKAMRVTLVASLRASIPETGNDKIWAVSLIFRCCLLSGADRIHHNWKFTPRNCQSVTNSQASRSEKMHNNTRVGVEAVNPTFRDKI